MQKIDVRCLLMVSVVSLLVPMFHFPEVIFSNFHLGHEDFVSFFYPIKHRFFEALKKGDLLTLGTNNLLGVNLLSAPHYQLLYPSNIYWLLFNHDLAAKLQFLTSYLLFGTGLFLWLSSLGISQLSAVVSSVSILSCGMIWSMQVHPLEIEALSTLPWAFFALQNALYQFEIKKINTGSIYICCSGVLLALSYYAGDPFMTISGLVYSSIIILTNQNTLKIFTQLKVFLGLVTIVVICDAFMVVRNIELLSISERSSAVGIIERFWYSSHPIRLLEFFGSIFIPSLASEKYLWPEIKRQAYPTWWYLNISFGILSGLTMLLGFFSKISYDTINAKKLRWLLMVFCVCVIVLSWGKHYEIVRFFWKEIWPLSVLRFPERVLKYILPSFAVFLAIGFDLIGFYLTKKLGIKNAWLMMLLLGVVNFADIHSSFLGATIATRNSIQNPNIPIEFGEITPFDRVLICRWGIDDVPVKKAFGNYIDVRKFGMNTFYDAEAVGNTILKFMDCHSALSGTATKWLGLSHIIAPYVHAAEHLRVAKKYGWVIQSQSEESNLVVYRRARNASIKSYFFYNPNFEKYNFEENLDQYGSIELMSNQKMLQTLLNNKFLIDPSFYLDETGRVRRITSVQSSFNSFDNNCVENEGKLEELEMQPLNDYSSKFLIDLKPVSKCSTWLAIPWRFVPGWRATIDGRPTVIRRVNELVLGVFVPQGSKRVIFEHGI